MLIISIFWAEYFYATQRCSGNLCLDGVSGLFQKNICTIFRLLSNYAMIIKRIIGTGNKNVVISLFRFLAGFVLIPSGLAKIQGHRFSVVFPDIHSQTFFEGLFNTGIYWNILGYCQLFTALLLFTQRLTALSSVIYFTTSLNIFLITISYGSNENMVVSIFLLLISVTILLFDWSKVRSLFGLYPRFSDLRKYRSVSSTWAVIGLFSYLIAIIAVIIVDTPS